MAIYHSICTFANDFEDLGGGYILVGVDTDENGAAKRPMGGVPEEQIDNILQDIMPSSVLTICHEQALRRLMEKFKIHLTLEKGHLRKASHKLFSRL